MIGRTTALIARLVLVLGVLSLSIPIPALMRCVTGVCPMPCCNAAKPAAKELPSCHKQAAKSCCAAKKADSGAFQSHDQGCDGCKCVVKSATPVALKKQDLAIADQIGVSISLAESLDLAVHPFVSYQPGIFGADSGPPIWRSDHRHSGRAPPVLG